MGTTNYTLKSAQFRREREASWRELEGLLDQIEKGGLGSLSHDEVNQLPALHRMVASSLSVARAISLDRNVLDYLTNLACRAHLVVYAGRREPRAAVRTFFTTRLPRIVRGFRRYVQAAAICLVAGVVVGYALTSRQPERFHSFVSPALSQGRDPEAATDSLRASLHRGEESRGDGLAAFASFLFSHNAEVGLMCLFLGFAAGIPVVFLLFVNGLTLGAMAALYGSRGLGTEFWAWVLPHGVTELLAVVLCGAAGLVFGTAIVFPGRETRLANLARRGRPAALMVIGAVGLFLVAALFEGLFRQLVQDVTVRWCTAAFMAAVWIAYFGYAGRGGRDERIDS